MRHGQAIWGRVMRSTRTGPVIQFGTLMVRHGGPNGLVFTERESESS